LSRYVTTGSITSVTQRILVFLCALFAVALVPQQASAQTVPGPAYRINPGDDLEISVWGDDRLQRVVRVLPDGTFGFPLIGTVMAAGQLPSDIQRIITAGLRPQYKDVVPQVTVLIKNPGGYQFSVIGKVKSPGTFTPGRYVNALEAIGLAGGPSDFAQTNRIRIIRKIGFGLQTIPLQQLGAALKGDFEQLTAQQVPPIQSGDTLVVP
jgi:polysaccharide export outer membrane protein